ncbi:MAG: DUF4345 domain-containing protein [Myxococcota bacterium]
MQPILARLLLRASALAFTGIGGAFLVAPSAMGRFVDVSLIGATADNDVRAVYGGLQIGLGVLLWTASRRDEWLRPGLYAQLILFSGLAAGRFVSWAVVGPPGTLGLALHGAELLAIVAGLLCLRRLPA